VIKGAGNLLCGQRIAVFEALCVVFLQISHRAFSSELSIGEGVDELGVFACQEGDVVGEILGDDKAFEAVSSEIFPDRESRSHPCGNSDALAGEAGDAVEDGLGRALQVSAEASDAHGGGEEGEELSVADRGVGPVVEGEGSGTAGFAAVFAEEPGNCRRRVLYRK